MLKASAARNWKNYVPQTAATTFALSSVVTGILLLCLKHNPLSCFSELCCFSERTIMLDTRQSWYPQPQQFQSKRYILFCVLLGKMWNERTILKDHQDVGGCAARLASDDVCPFRFRSAGGHEVGSRLAHAHCIPAKLWPHNKVKKGKRGKGNFTFGWAWALQHFLIFSVFYAKLKR